MNTPRYLGLGWIVLQAVAAALTMQSLPIAFVVIGLAVVRCATTWHVPARAKTPAFILGVTCAVILLNEGLWRWLNLGSDRPMGEVMTARIAESLLLIQVFQQFTVRRHESFPLWTLSLGIGTFYFVFNRAVTPPQRELGLVIATTVVTLFALQCRLAGLGGSGPRAAGPRAGSSKPVRGIVAGVLATSVLATWPLASQLSAQIQRVQRWVSQTVTFNVMEVRSTRSYVRVASLRSIRSEQLQNPTQVALRVFAQRLPGYLRSRCYDEFRGSQWRMSESRRGPRWNRLRDKRILTPVDQPPTGIDQPVDDQHLFSLRPLSRGPWERVEVWNDPARGEQYFLPLDAAFLMGSGEFLAVDANDIVRTGVLTERPYIAYASRFPAATRLSDEDRAKLLTPVIIDHPEIDAIVDELAAADASPRDKINAVADFFQSNYEYSLRPISLPPNTDPLIHFLWQRPAAHCEYFATGTAALLRKMQVPCRYVTGYVVREASEYGDYWLARNQNAHAWVEAYDDQTRRWVVVESTPGMAASDQDNQRLLLDPRSTTPADRLRRVLELSRYWLEPRWRQTWLKAAARAVQGPLVVVLIVAGLIQLARWRPFGRFGRARTGDASPLVARSRQLRRLDARVRRFRFDREPGETLHQFSTRLQADAGEEPFLRAAAQWYRAYAAQRYGSAEPSRGLELPPAPRPPGTWRLAYSSRRSASTSRMT